MEAKKGFSTRALSAIAVIDVLTGAFGAICSLWGAYNAASTGGPVNSFLLAAASATFLLAIGIWLLLRGRSRTKRR